jgi:hypothetical protein
MIDKLIAVIAIAGGAFLLWDAKKAISLGEIRVGRGISSFPLGRFREPWLFWSWVASELAIGLTRILASCVIWLGLVKI